MKKNIIIYSLIIVSIISAIATCLFYFSGYHSIDSKNEKEIEKYLIEYIKEEYNITPTLKLDNKELETFCVINIDGCLLEGKNTSIYKYNYNGKDSNNNEFQITYTNPYIGKYKYHKESIKETYYIIANSTNLEKHLNKNSQYNKLYYSTKDETYSSVIYLEELNKENILKINNLFNNINSNYIIVFIPDYEVYNYLISEINKLEDKIYWTNKIQLNKVKNYTYLDKITLEKFNSLNTTNIKAPVIINYDKVTKETSITIYKQKENI